MAGAGLKNTGMKTIGDEDTVFEIDGFTWTEDGVNIADAVMGAQEFTWRTLAAGFRPGMGQFIPDRLFWSREEDDEDDES